MSRNNKRRKAKNALALAGALELIKICGIAGQELIKKQKERENENTIIITPANSDGEEKIVIVKPKNKKK